MKFHWFAEASYPKLPADFRARRISSWVDTPKSLHDPNVVGEMCRMFIRLMQQADRDGFDGLAVNEHHQTPFAVTPSPNLLAAALAHTTRRAAILIIGDSLALYNPPTRVAEEMAWLDCLSGGRVIAGFVFGTPMDSVFAYGIPPAELRDRFEEARQLILKSWAEQEPFAFNGKYTKLRYVNLWPKPVQPKFPIWVPGSGSVETWDLCIENDYCYGHLSFSGLHAAKPLVDAWWEYCDMRGAEMNPHRMAFTQLICCANTDAEAERLYSDGVKYFYRNRYTNPAYEAPPGYRSTKSVQAIMGHRRIAESKLSAEDRARAASGEMSFWEYDQHGFIIAGTPARVRQRLRELCVDLRIGQLIACLHQGDLPEEVAVENTRLMGQEVIPGLRDLWADQEDRWTPAASQLALARAAE